ncbi:MAG TPA: glutaredoxin domain-containing protein [Actinomycetota bacterium]|nr:glutaredoxin domain-containing protein [Actinomycetota bacterium]
MDEIIKVYGASWCPDCRRAKRFLGDQRISFEWHDIESDPDGVRIVQARNAGNNIIPTIIFPDGSHLSEPVQRGARREDRARAVRDDARLRPDRRRGRSRGVDDVDLCGA